jgi:hypothetical protein
VTVIASPSASEGVAIQGVKDDALRSLDCFVVSLLAMTVPSMPPGNADRAKTAPDKREGAFKVG